MTLAGYLEEVVERLVAIRGDRLVGVYAGGSVALGAYEQGRSDVDVVAVRRGPLARETKERIAAALRHEALPCPARGLEFVVYAESVTRTPTAEAAFELNLNTGARMPFKLELEPTDAERHWYVLDRAILNGHGKALAGPPAREVFAELPRELLLPALVEAVRWHETPGRAADDDSVLNACRALRFARTGQWSSKRDAGAWALDHVEDRQLVRAGLEARGGDVALPPERVARLLDDVVRALV